MRLLCEDLWGFSKMGYWLSTGALSKQTIYYTRMMSAVYYREPRRIKLRSDEALDILDISEFPEMWKDVIFDSSLSRSTLSGISKIYESRRKMLPSYGKKRK